MFSNVGKLERKPSLNRLVLFVLAAVLPVVPVLFWPIGLFQIGLIEALWIVFVELLFGFTFYMWLEENKDSRLRLEALDVVIIAGLVAVVQGVFFLCWPQNQEAMLFKDAAMIMRYLAASLGLPFITTAIVFWNL